MLRSLLVSTSLLALANPGYAFSAETVSKSEASASPAPSHAPRPWLPIEQGMARFRVSFGRLQFDRLGGRDRQRHSVEQSDGTTESYWVRPASDGIEAEYERVRPGADRVAFRCEPCGTLRVTREDLSGSGASVELLQPAEGWMTLSLSEGEERRTLRAPSLWHLYLADREACRRYVTPTLAELCTAADYEEIGDRLAELIVERASESQPAARDEALGWIHDLSDPSFKVRRAAEEQLRQMGPSLVAWVRLFPVDRLDRDQRHRLRELISTLEASSDDRPDRLALWLAEDPWIWGELLSHADSGVRQLAAERIELLTGEAVEAAAEMPLVDDATLLKTREVCQQDRGSLR